MKTNPKGKYFRLNKYICFISHISKKGNAVGYVFYDRKWYGPISWGKFGNCDLNRSDFNLENGQFKINNILVSGPSINLNEIYPIKDLLPQVKNNEYFILSQTNHITIT